MAKSSVLNAEERSERGTSVSRRLRREGLLPGIVNDSEGKTRMVQLPLHSLEVLLQHHVGENLILDLKVGQSKSMKVLLKEVQHDSLTGGLLHADFAEISMTDKMKVNIAVTLTGEAEGVLQEGGVLEQLVREVEVECLPADLVEEIEVDISALQIGDSLSVGDLSVDSKLAILTASDIAVALVSAPRTEEEDATPDEEAAEGAEPGVVGEAKDGEEEGEEAEGGKPAEKDADKGKGKGKEES